MFKRLAAGTPSSIGHEHVNTDSANLSSQTNNVIDESDLNNSNHVSIDATVVNDLNNSNHVSIDATVVNDFFILKNDSIDNKYNNFVDRLENENLEFYYKTDTAEIPAFRIINHMQIDPRVAVSHPPPPYSSILCSPSSTKLREPSLVKRRLTPLPGVPIPKSESGWKEMNSFFHSANLFRFATGPIVDLDLAASEFNQSIYSYLKGKYGTVGSSVLPEKKADGFFEAKYEGCSRSKIRRELGKLKRRGPVIKDSPLCEEILYLSRRLRLEIKHRPQPNKPVTDLDFGTGFFSACRKIFADLTEASPAFDISACGEYFLRVLCLPGSLRS